MTHIDGSVVPSSDLRSHLMAHDADTVAAWPWPETCEDRGYRCCDLTPPVPPCGEMTDAEYGEWYDRHVEAFQANA